MVGNRNAKSKTLQFLQRGRAEAVGDSADDKNEKNETLRFVLEQKISFTNMLGNVCMTWWVSSVVFCGSILAAVWLNKQELAASGVIGWLGFVLFFFFATVVCFGILVIRYLDKLQKEISTLAKELNHEGFFSNELSIFKLGMIDGTSSFALVLIVWVILWIGLWLGYY